MLSWQQALKAVNMSYINSMIQQPSSYFVYNQLAHYFLNTGISWIHSSGIIKRSLSEFSARTYGDVFFDAYQVNSQDSYISDLLSDETIDRSHLIERPLGQPRKYRYIGEYVYQDEVTGERIHAFKSYYADREMSISEANELLYSSFDFEKYSEMWNLQYVRLANVEHNVDWSY